MKHDLDYFLEFLDNPDVFNNIQYRKFLDEWIEYLKINEGKIDFLGDDWKERRERMHIQYDERFNIAPELKKEAEEIVITFAKLDQLNEEEKVALFIKNISFMKKNQKAFRIPNEDIILAEEKLKKLLQSIEDCKTSEEKLRQSKLAYESSIEKLEEAMVEEYERTGKMPSVNIDLREKKKSGH